MDAFVHLLETKSYQVHRHEFINLPEQMLMAKKRLTVDTSVPTRTSTTFKVPVRLVTMAVNTNAFHATV